MAFFSSTFRGKLPRQQHVIAAQGIIHQSLPRVAAVVDLGLVLRDLDVLHETQPISENENSRPSRWRTFRHVGDTPRQRSDQ